MFDEVFIRAAISHPGSLAAVRASGLLGSLWCEALVCGGRILGTAGREAPGGRRMALLPFCKLAEEAMECLLASAGRLVDAGRVGAGVVDIAPAVASSLDVEAFDCRGHLVERVDSPEGLERAS